jgi:hypothetical protein
MYTITPLHSLDNIKRKVPKKHGWTPKGKPTHPALLYTHLGWIMIATLNPDRIERPTVTSTGLLALL